MNGQQIPHPEATVLGYTLAEFRMLDDEQVQNVRMQLESSAWIAHDGLLSEAAIVGKLFNQFVYYRRYGIPDKEVSDDDLALYMVDHIDSQVYANVRFGMWPANHEMLSRDIRTIVETIIEYAASTHHPSEMPLLDTIVMTEHLAVPVEDIPELIGRQVLLALPEADTEDDGTEYTLGEPYYEHWLCRAAAGYLGLGKGY